MGQLESNSAVSTYASDYQYRANQADSTEKKSRVYGRTIGQPQLSEKAQKYYEKLKAKYGNMDFILVSPEMKEQAERNKGMYSSSKELLVLIDSDKIEKMAEDEEYRKKYESILNNATAQMNMMKSQLGANADRVSSFGMTFDDNGNASFFAVVDKSQELQRERIEEKRAEAKEERKANAKKEAERAAEKRRAEKGSKSGKTDGVTVEASSWEDLLKKINDVIYSERADYIQTDSEKKVGQSFDYSV